MDMSELRTDRAKMIADIADDISCGFGAGKYDRAFFLDSLMDNQRVTADDMDMLLTSSETNYDRRCAVRERICELVKQDAIEFFTNGDGTDFIDERLALAEKEREADAEYEMKYGSAAINL